MGSLDGLVFEKRDAEWVIGGFFRMLEVRNGEFRIVDCGIISSAFCA